ncbi:MAG: DUF4147 domain-containing protein [Acidobacteria bacterium]|nr:DUF4147 domain-containing protein [Acidobacteriota bacterium]
MEVIASGPTVPDPATFADAWDVLVRHGVLDAVPPPVRAHLTEGLEGRAADTPKPGDPLFGQVHNVLVGNNRQAALAAAAEASRGGFRPIVVSDRLQGEARAAGRILAGLARSAAAAARGRPENWTPALPPASGLAGEPFRPGENRTPNHCPDAGASFSDGIPPRVATPPAPLCLILGGETTVTLRGEGLGGRNQETALAAALELDGLEGALVVCLATDGGDGPTDAAGAFADGETVSRARALGLDPADHLARNDAYPFFAALGDLVVTGPTRTNVNDLALVIVHPGQTGPGNLLQRFPPGRRSFN